MVYNLFDEPEKVPDEERNSQNGWPDEPKDDRFAPVPFDPPSENETYRRSGLAWSVGVVFFASVVFMLGVGWIADFVLGTAPWGLVIGIVLGSVIGFVQFFRISSQIFGSGNQESEIHSLMSPPEEDDK